MSKNRLEAFSDGVLAIIITIMVLELKVPHKVELSALTPLWPVFISYILSFVNIAIYWNNHHHLMQAVEHVNGKILWANTHLLFWLSLFPFVTGWMGENDFALWPVVAYGVVSLMAGVAYFLLTRSLTVLHGRSSQLAKAIGSDKKGKWSVFFYGCGIAVSFIDPWIGFISYIVVAGLWFIPDKRIEKEVDKIEADKD